MRLYHFSFCVLLGGYCDAALVINTWNFPGAAETAWKTLTRHSNAIHAIESGLSFCEVGHHCDRTVGFGGTADESGETTLDAMIYDGKTKKAGAVGNLRRIKNATSVARHVLQYTQHTLLTGDQATAFAISMGFKEESLNSSNSISEWNRWLNNNCQPNFWQNVAPNAKEHCGPYLPLKVEGNQVKELQQTDLLDKEYNHDTIGMIVLDNQHNIVAGTSTNGLDHKIPGRVGDSPVPGAGAFADNEVGAACCTGNGDIMMLFSPSFLAVEKMRDGHSAKDAAEIAVNRIASAYPSFSGAVITVSVNGEYGVACNGMKEFPYVVINDELKKVSVMKINCSNSSPTEERATK